MARRYLDSNDYSGLSGMQFSNNNPSVLAAIIWTILLSVMLLVITLFLGPIADFFVNWLINDPLNAGNPYVTSAVAVFQWWYIFIFATWVIGVIMIWRAVFYSVSYERMS
jgi:hypothetical protein